MSYATQREIPALIAAREDFEGSNMYGVRYQDGAHEISPGRANTAPPIGSRYVIWSYATPIAWVDPNGVAVIPDQKYSITTSNHQSLARHGLGHDSDAQDVMETLAELDALAMAGVLASLGVAA